MQHTNAECRHTPDPPQRMRLRRAMRRGAGKFCGVIHFLKNRYCGLRRESGSGKGALGLQDAQHSDEIWECVPDGYQPGAEETIAEVEYISSGKPRKFRVIPRVRN